MSKYPTHRRLLKSQASELRQARKQKRGSGARRWAAFELKSLRKSGLHALQDRSGDYNPTRGRKAARMVRKASK